MDTSPDDPTPPAPLGAAIGCVSNAGAQRFLLEAESTTGYVAWRTADGTTLISNAQQVSIAATPYLIFWACAGYEDTTPDGRIVSFDCHDNALTRLDVQALTGLEYLDCSFNQLRDLALAGLLELQGLDADNNQLATLDVRGLPALRVLNCACNRSKLLISPAWTCWPSSTARAISLSPCASRDARPCRTARAPAIPWS